MWQGRPDRPPLRRPGSWKPSAGPGLQEKCPRIRVGTAFRPEAVWPGNLGSAALVCTPSLLSERVLLRDCDQPDADGTQGPRRGKGGPVGSLDSVSWHPGLQGQWGRDTQGPLAPGLRASQRLGEQTRAPVSWKNNVLLNWVTVCFEIAF